MEGSKSKKEVYCRDFNIVSNVKVAKQRIISRGQINQGWNDED